MDNSNYQKNISFSNIDKNTINFIVFMPFNEFYYIYSINNLDSQHLIEKDTIFSLLKQFNEIDYNKVEYYIQRFFSFIYLPSNNSILKLEQSILNKNNLISSINNELEQKIIQKEDDTQNNTILSKYKNFLSLFNN